MNMHLHILLVILIGGCLLAIATTTARADESRPSAASGTYRYIGGAAEEARKAAAIDAVVGSMFFAVRGVARSRLTATTRTAPSVTLVFGPNDLRYVSSLGLDVSTPTDGTPVTQQANGESVRISQLVTGNKVIQTFVAPDGTRTNELTLAGALLLVHVTITSPKLPKPVVFDLTYKR